MFSGTPYARRARRHRSTVVTATLALPLLTLAACGTTAAPDPSAGTSSAMDSGTSGGTTGAGAPSYSAAPTAAPPKSSAGGSGPSAGKKVRTAVYFLHGAKVSAAPRTVAAPATATAAVRALLAGPSRYEGSRSRTTAIPPGTDLRSVAVRNHVATVDLSGRYDDAGGSGSMRGRLAQVVFTLTRFPAVHKVAFEIEGKPVTHFGPRRTVLNGPVGRADFEDVSPAVLVESPLLGDTGRTPLRVWGSANTSEAEFRLKVTDAAGHAAADVLVRATSGTGVRGTFDVTVPYRVVRAGPGLLTAYYVSPKDGRPVTVDTVPLTVNH